MKKTFLKKEFASALALAMVVTSLAVPTSASAASVTKVVKQGGGTAPATLYVGDKGTDYGLSKTYAGNKYTWTISDSAIATINKAGVVTAKAPGAVTIKATARNAKGKWLNAFTHKININLRVTSVDIGTDDFTLVLGKEKALSAVKAPANSTDVLKYVSSNPEIAAVDAKTGVVKAVAYGDATITVLAKATDASADASKYNRKDTVKVTVVAESTGSTITTGGGSGGGGNAGGDNTSTARRDGDTFRLPVPIEKLKKVDVRYGNLTYTVSNDTLAALTSFLSDEDTSYDKWLNTADTTKRYDGVDVTVTGDAGVNTKTVELSSIPGKFDVTVTNDGNVAVNRQGSGITYTINKQSTTLLTISNAPSDLTFNVTY